MRNLQHGSLRYGALASAGQTRRLKPALPNDSQPVKQYPEGSVRMGDGEVLGAVDGRTWHRPQA